ncbi:MAG: hypothetical protein IJS94_07585, partial [Clostridia bacterium]|nr:hypothetical protein [Clostridia bacterium]
GGGTSEAHLGKITSFEIVTLHTSGMRFVKVQEIVMKENGAEVSEYGLRFKDGGRERVLQKRVICSEQEILKLLNDCKLISWDGFYGKHPKRIKDGTMFTLKATVNGDRQIYAHGSQNFPKHYRELTDGIYALLNRDE